MCIIYKNNKELEKIYFKRQNKSRFIKEVSMQAEAEDVIKVVVFSSNGGVRKKAYVIPEEETEGK